MEYKDLDENLKIIFADIEREIKSAVQNFPLGFHSNHEALGVIREEYKELEDYVFKIKDVYYMDNAMKKESIQLASMAIRFILDRWGK